MGALRPLWAFRKLLVDTTGSTLELLAGRNPSSVSTIPEPIQEVEEEAWDRPREGPKRLR